LSNNQDCEFENLRVERLTGDDRAYKTRYTRGIAAGGNRRCRLISPVVSVVDQGIDISGSDGNIDLIISGARVSECCTWGIKLANSAVNVTVSGAVVQQCGSSCYVVSGPSEARLINKSRDCRFIDCWAIDAGYNGFPASHCGFRVMTSRFDDEYPSGIHFIRCVAEDRQDRKTMHFGFMSDTRVLPGRASTNSIKDCRASGYREAPWQGLARI
jgi:hypothetical protein